MRIYGSLSIVAIWVFFAISLVLCDLHKGDIVPAFILPTVDGQMISLEVVKKSAKTMLKVTISSNIKGRKKQEELKFKLLLINFSTTWCPGCQVVREVLRNLWKRYSQKGLLIIAVYDDDPNAIKKYAKVYKIPYIIAIDNKSKVTTSYKVEAYPTIYLVNTSGEVVSIPDDYSEANLSRIIENLGIK